LENGIYFGINKKYKILATKPQGKDFGDIDIKEG
jgi:hypothetical protein